MNLDNEKELEDYLTGNLVQKSGINVVRDIVGGHIFDLEVSQLKLGTYGVTDIVRFSFDVPMNTLSVQITELKKGSLNRDALFQICRYKTGIESLFYSMNLDFDIDFEGVLIGSSISNSEVVWAMNEIDWLKIYRFHIEIDKGIYFTQMSKETYVNENFNKEVEELLTPMIHEKKCIFSRQTNSKKNLKTESVASH